MRFHLPYEIDIPISAFYLIISSSINLFNFFDYFGYFSPLARSLQFVLGVLVISTWIDEFVVKYTKQS